MCIRWTTSFLRYLKNTKSEKPPGTNSGTAYSSSKSSAFDPTAPIARR